MKIPFYIKNFSRNPRHNFISLNRVRANPRPLTVQPRLKVCDAGRRMLDAEIHFTGAKCQTKPNVCKLARDFGPTCNICS